LSKFGGLVLLIEKGLSAGCAAVGPVVYIDKRSNMPYKLIVTSI
jgi:hypothetical protein